MLVAHIAPLLPPDASVLDVGSGDGFVAESVMRARPDVTISGVDPLVRPGARIPVREFDGLSIPFPDRSFDATLIVDVLHHATDPQRLLAEAVRVTRDCLVIKDHRREGLLAGATLRFMDAIGNRRHGVSLPYNYLAPAQWAAAFADLGIAPDAEIRRLGLYPWPASLLFDRSLHFIARLRRVDAG